MSASSTEIKGIVKSDCSSSSSKRNESVYSVPSVKNRMLQRKSMNRPAGFMSGSNAIATGLSADIRQRVLSARQHRHKNVQNQLNLALQQNTELANENRLLRTLHKRQDNALAKYEGSAGELPQLIKSHAEEMRVWQTKYRALNVEKRELNKKIVQKDKIINDLNDRLKHLTALISERHLEEREVLQAKVEMFERKLAEKEDEIKMLLRRNTLEAKNFKTQLANERKKYKEICNKQNTEKTNGSSIDSDNNSAKDVKEVKTLKSFCESSAISEETPPIDFHVNIDDDDDLVIKRILDKDSNGIHHVESNEIMMQHLEDIHLFSNEETHSIHAIQKKIQKDIEKNEALLDLHCDAIRREIGSLNLTKDLPLINHDVSIDHEIGPMKPMNDVLSFKSERAIGSKETLSNIPDRSKVRTASCLPRFNINLAKPLKRNPIDPQKKNKLLVQLKSIDSGHGVS